MMRGWRKMRRGERCPICTKPDNCSFSLDGEAVFCRRVPSNRPGRGGYVHRLSDDDALMPRSPVVTASPVVTVPRASADHLDGIYTTMLRRCLTLSRAHADALLKRGLTVAEIARNGYRTTPDAEAAEGVAADLSRYGLSGVPGFFERGGVHHMRHIPPGLFIPYRDERGRIAGLQYRPDERRERGGKYIWLSTPPDDERGRFPGGCSSGAPLHFSRFWMMPDAEEVTITEGALKADITAQFLNVPVIAGAGVSLFGRDFASRLKSQFHKLKTVAVAFDSDFRGNAAVRAALETLLRDLSQASFRVRVRTWPDKWKGIDDYLLAQSLREDRRAA